MPQPVHLGIISDTHMPARWKSLPAALFEALSGVDLLLHAGDLGELWVLDGLSAIAPVVAVHGNDETRDAQAALPYLQTVVVAGRRIVLTHSHYPDVAEEMASRQIDDWQPKLARLASFGKQHGAEIVVFGHSHIPMATQYDGVWLLNPGAIASGGWGTRQTIQTVARMTVEASGAPSIEFFDLKTGKPYVPQIDLEAGFLAANRQFSESILEPELQAQWTWMVDNLYSLDPEAWLSVFAPVAHECWSGERATIGIADVVSTAKAGADRLPALALERMAASPAFVPYL